MDRFFKKTLIYRLGKNKAFRKKRKWIEQFQAFIPAGESEGGSS